MKHTLIQNNFNKINFYEEKEMKKRTVPRFIKIKPKTVMSRDFSFTAVRFSCRIDLIDKVKLLFSKYVWFEINSNNVHRLNSLALQEIPEIDK